MKKLKEVLLFLRTPKGIRYLLGAAIALWVVVGFFAPKVQLTRAREGTAVAAVTGTLKVSAAREVLIKTQAEGRVEWMRPLDPSGKLALKHGETFGQLETGGVDREIELYEARQKTLREQIAIGSDNEIAIANARNDLGVAEALYKSGQYSVSDLEKKRREVQRLERNWEKERLDLEKNLAEATYELQTRLDKRAKMTLKSPIDGNLCAQYAVPGQILTMDAPVALVRSVDLAMEVSLAEEDFPGVAVGQRATLNFTGVEKNFEGKVTALAAFANSETRRRSVFVTLKVPTDVVVPGSTGYATIVKAERPNAILVPRRAVLGNQVYTIAWGHLRKIKVKTGFQNLSSVEILDGLWNNTGVALSGAVELKNGMRVRGEWVK